MKLPPEVTHECMGNIVPYALGIAVALLEKGWTQGRNALDKNGNDVLPTSHEACKFCIAGALTEAARQVFGLDRDGRLMSSSEKILVEECMEIIVRHIPDKDLLRWEECVKGASNAMPFTKVTQWNDHRERMHKQVLNVMRESVAST